jgi:acetyl-CoA synthetase
MTYTWHPSPDYLQNSNVSRLMRKLGTPTVAELRARSVADVGAFWEAVVQDLGIEFRVPYRGALDLAGGIAYPEWFPGGQINVVEATLARWAHQTPDTPAVVHEAEDGTVRTLTYAELSDQVARVRGGLRNHGIGKGDAVAIYLPMVPEAIIALYAVASIGAIAVPLFSGFAATAIASRIQDAGARAVITADGTVRRGKTVRMLPQVREALAECPSVELTVVVSNLGEPPEPERDRQLPWRRLLSSEPDLIAEPTAASDILLLAYTSGTTGKPKGAVHTHAGFLVKTASEVAYGFDITPGRVFCWITDMG